MDFRGINYWQSFYEEKKFYNRALLLEKWKNWLSKGTLVKVHHIKKLSKPHTITFCIICNVLELISQNFSFFQRFHKDFELIKVFKDLYAYKVHLTLEHKIGTSVKRRNTPIDEKKRLTTYGPKRFDRNYIVNFTAHFCCEYCRGQPEIEKDDRWMTEDLDSLDLAYDG